MLETFTDEKFLWYLMRGTGVTLMLLFTLSTALGIFSTARAGNRFWPRFATQALHRNVSLISVALLVAHILTAVTHSFVDIRWIDVLIPFIGPYEPLWVGLGTLATDLVIVVVATSLVRERLSHRAWRAIHLTSYAAWVLGVVHGIGLGTDATTTPWGLGATVVSIGIVAASVVVRFATLSNERKYAA
ncbi:ferric reductase-like transmembrane domain-containing protein [Kineosporia sp. A_224]|uniref:ferric reductase-like transmembrane domain-containing protein n=1 Tax=Kineosporia sp. A_224 TaxID=1962180 RepID=UPI000B4B5DCB|nr:ferric reductase-like transmembrane domain-containing protein [Kineosporia sp. A_224]